MFAIKLNLETEDEMPTVNMECETSNDDVIR